MGGGRRWVCVALVTTSELILAISYSDSISYHKLCAYSTNDSAACKLDSSCRLCMVVQRLSDRARLVRSRAIHSGDGRGMSHVKDFSFVVTYISKDECPYGRRYSIAHRTTIGHSCHYTVPMVLFPIVRRL